MTGRRARVIVDNDYCGDPDGLFQLAHHALVGSVDIPLVVGSHLAPGDPMHPGAGQADRSAEIATEVLALVGRDIPVVAGSGTALADPTGLRTEAADRIVREAMRPDGDGPLFYAAGGGLTDLALALEQEPAIASRLTVVWIGGAGYEEDDGEGARAEFNVSIDVDAAAQVVDSDLPLWQVPRDAYRQCLVSDLELEARVRPAGRLGERLMQGVDRARDLHDAGGARLAETYCLGDSPLVLATALQSFYGADPSSTGWRRLPARQIRPDGRYGAVLDARRQVRVATRIDTRLLFEDLFLRLARRASAA